MKLTIIICCDGCGATVPPIHMDTAWLRENCLDDIEQAIEAHRLKAKDCPYFYDGWPSERNEGANP